MFGHVFSWVQVYVSTVSTVPFKRQCELGNSVVMLCHISLSTSATRTTLACGPHTRCYTIYITHLVAPFIIQHRLVFSVMFSDQIQQLLELGVGSLGSQRGNQSFGLLGSITRQSSELGDFKRMQINLPLFNKKKVDFANRHLRPCLRPFAGEDGLNWD